MGFYDRYDRYGYESPHQRELRVSANRVREKEQKRQDKLKQLPTVQVTVHTALKSHRYKDLKGLGAYIVDVASEGGEVAFRLPQGVHWHYLMGNKPPGEHELWDDYFFDYYNKLFERYQTTWLRALCNPNLAFIDTKATRDRGDISWTPRAIARRFFIQVLHANGYKLTEGISK